MRVWRKLESGIVTSERLSRVSDSAKWLFALLIAAQDDEGKYPWSPTMIRALTVTTSWDASACDSLLSELRVANVAEVRDGFVVLRHGAEKNGTPANSKKYVMLYPPQSTISEPNDESLTSRERVGAESLTIVQSRVELEERRGEPPKSPAARGPRPETSITPEFIEQMVLEWGSSLGGDDATREIIADALNHKAMDKRKDKQLYLRGWLRRDAKTYKKEHANGRTAPGGFDNSHGKFARIALDDTPGRAPAE